MITPLTHTPGAWKNMHRKIVKNLKRERDSEHLHTIQLEANLKAAKEEAIEAKKLFVHKLKAFKDLKKKLVGIFYSLLHCTTCKIKCFWWDSNSCGRPLKQ